MRTLDRRSFLRHSGLLLAAPFVPPSFPLIPKKQLHFVSSSQVVQMTVLKMLGEFALNVLGNVAAQGFIDWFENLTQGQERVESANTMMINAGFNNFEESQVYYHNMGYGNVYFYGVLNEDNFNCCAPFFYSSRTQSQDVFIEGPVIAGLYYASQDWGQYQSQIAAAAGLIPISTEHNYPAEFEKSFDEPFVYGTQAGQLSINYHAEPEKQLGIISLVAENDNGGKLFGHDYGIEWDWI